MCWMKLKVISVKYKPTESLIYKINAYENFEFIYIDKNGKGGSGYTIPCNVDENNKPTSILVAIDNSFATIGFIENNIVKWDYFPYGV